MGREKNTLYKNAIEKFGKDGLFRKAAISLNDISMMLLGKIRNKEPIENIENDEDFFNCMASAYISIQRLINIIPWNKRQKLWTTVHHQLDELKELVESE